MTDSVGLLLTLVDYLVDASVVERDARGWGLREYRRDKNKCRGTPSRDPARGRNKIVRDFRGNVDLFDFCGASGTT